MSSPNAKEADLRKRTFDLLKMVRDHLSQNLPRSIARQAGFRLASSNVEEAIVRAGHDDLLGIHGALLSTIQAPWLHVLGLFRGEIPDDVSIRAIDQAALLPHIMLTKEQKGDPGAVEAAKAKTEKALHLRMVARIDLALRRAESEGHTLVPVETIMKLVGRQIEMEADALQEDRDNGEGTLSLDLGAMAAAGPAKADYGLDADPSDASAFRQLFVQAVREGMSRGNLAGEKREGVPHLQRMETARAERAIADFIQRIEMNGAGPDLGSIADRMARDMSLSDQQKAAIGFLIQKGYGVLTGGPGTGKTHTLARLVGYCMSRPDLQVTLAAPTGKAAARMNAMLDRSLRNTAGTRGPEGLPRARTIHSLLEAVPDEPFGYRFTPKTIAPGLLVVDECSMIDTHLMKQLVMSVDPDQTAILFVGDPNQIPPVGPGQPFADIVKTIAARHNAAGLLTEVHRQSAGNPVIRLASAMQERLPLELHLHREADPDAPILHLDTRDPEIDATFIAARIEEACRVNGLDPSYDTMTIAPQYEGRLGVNALNDSLKALFNPVRKDSEGFLVGASGSRIDIGDKVIMTRRNLVADGVMNGDTGILLSLNCPYVDKRNGSTTRGVMIDMGSRNAPDTRIIRYEDAAALDLGYAITAHRAQGDEAPLVTVVCQARNQSMLNRNLIYTAVTRTRDHLITVGNADLVEEQCHMPAPHRVCRLPGLLAKIPGADAPGAQHQARQVRQAPGLMPDDSHLETASRAKNRDQVAELQPG